MTQELIQISMNGHFNNKSRGIIIFFNKFNYKKIMVQVGGENQRNYISFREFFMCLYCGLCPETDPTKILSLLDKETVILKFYEICTLDFTDTNIKKEVQNKLLSIFHLLNPNFELEIMDVFNYLCD